MPPPAQVPQQQKDAINHVPTDVPKPVRPAPPETRQRTGKKFTERYVQETYYTDKRLVPYLYQLIETYPSKTAMATEMIVLACKVRGIEIPEDWQKQTYPEE